MMSNKKSSTSLKYPTITLSHLNKLLFAQSGITKKDVVTYYQKIAPFLLPHVHNHLIVMQRFPEGIAQEGFYQKQIPGYFPSWIKRKKINLQKKDTQTLVLIDDSATLIYLANQAVLVFHSWLSSSEKINYPDKMVFDLDPQENSLRELRFGAKKLKAILEKHGLTPFLMTTGSRGYHVVVPLIPVHSFEKVRTFARTICQELANAYPDRFTTEINKSKRKKRIFLDYLRNSFGQTSVVCYSLRALEGAPIATPISWAELSKTKPQQYSIKNIFRRLARKQDPWHNFSKYAKNIVIKKGVRKNSDAF